jgi:hypothetical protein
MPVLPDACLLETPARRGLAHGLCCRECAWTAHSAKKSFPAQQTFAPGPTRSGTGLHRQLACDKQATRASAFSIMLRGSEWWLAHTWRELQSGRGAVHGHDEGMPVVDPAARQGQIHAV